MKKVALITGGTKGIGQAISLKFLSEGYYVVATYKNDSATAETFTTSLASEYKDYFSTYACDGTNRVAVRALMQEIDKKFNRLDVLVNNAGYVKSNLTANISEAEWDAAFDNNVKSTFLTTQQAIKLMFLQKSGSIVNLSSIAAQFSGAGQSAYAASKSAIEGVTRAWAMEFAPFHIRVNAVAPGLVNEGMSALASISLKENQLKLSPLGRIANACEVADSVYWLASDKASFITGHILPINGGLRM